MSSNRRNGFVAHKLSEALSNFLEVDSSLVESRLLNPTKSKIILYNVKVKPRLIQQDSATPIEISGVIEKVQFKWKWNYFNSSKTYKGIMKKTVLTIKGAKIFMKPVDRSHPGLLTRLQDASMSSINSSLKEQEEERKQPKLIRHIIEQFSLHIDDIEIHIELPSISSKDPNETRTLVVVGQGMELDPIGYKKTSKSRFKRKKHQDIPKKKSQVQELKIASLSAKVLVEKNGMTKEHVFIKPFRYTATAKRFHGARFSGFDTGLEVLGHDVTKSLDRLSEVHLGVSSSYDDYDWKNTSHETSSTQPSSSPSLADEIEVYAIDDEIETTLNQNMSLSVDISMEEGYSHSPSIKSEMEPNDRIFMIFGEEQCLGLFGVIELFTGQSVDAEDAIEVGDIQRREFLTSVVRHDGLDKLQDLAPRTYMKAERHLNKSSIYQFPFPYIHAVLPNNAKVVARDCCFNLRTDGSMNFFEGDGGVLLNDEMLMEDGASFTVDLNHKDIILRPQKNYNIVASSSGPHSMARKRLMSSNSTLKPSDFEVNLDAIKTIGEGAGEILTHRQTIVGDTQHLQPSDSFHSTSTEEAVEWSLKVQGTTEIKF